MSKTMQPLKPYLIRAYYDWICESQCTPYILVQANLPHVAVPTQYIDPDDNTIVFNISPVAINHLMINKKKVEFQASFNGTVWTVTIPSYAVLGIYAQENDEGIMFEIDPNEVQTESAQFAAEKSPLTAQTKHHPHLRVIKNEDK